MFLVLLIKVFRFRVHWFPVSTAVMYIQNWKQDVKILIAHMSLVTNTYCQEKGKQGPLTGYYPNYTQPCNLVLGLPPRGDDASGVVVGAEPTLHGACRAEVWLRGMGPPSLAYE